MTDRELMQMALDALKNTDKKIVPGGLSTDDREKLNKAAKALRDRLAQPEPEPVAWVCHQQNGVNSLWWMKDQAIDRNAGHQFTPLYAAPPKREWVGLTNEEIWEMEEYKQALTDEETRFLYRFAKTIQAKLKEKNT